MLKVFFDTDNIEMITDMLDAEEHSHYPIQLFLSIDEPLKITIAGNAAGVLACAHLARRSLPLRRQCSHSRTLPAVHFPYGGGAHIHEPCPPFTSLTAAVLTFTHLKSAP